MLGTQCAATTTPSYVGYIRCIHRIDKLCRSRIDIIRVQIDDCFFFRYSVGRVFACCLPFALVWFTCGIFPRKGHKDIGVDSVTVNEKRLAYVRSHAT